MNNRLYVGNLSFYTTEDALMRTFAQVGEVTETKLVIDRETGRSRGFAFVVMADKGVDTIAVVSVNDAFVMSAWKRDTDQRDEALFLADGNADFTKAIGMELDASGNGLGIRSHRYSMLVKDGVVEKLNREPNPGKVEVSGGDTLLGQL